MPTFRRTSASAAALALGVSLLAAPGLPANATPDPQEPGIIGSQAAAEAPSQSVTLINGDLIRVSIAADGTPSAIVPEGKDYYTRVLNNELYVVPVDAQELLAAGTLDMELFNVTGLLSQGYGDADTEALPLIVQAEPAALNRTRGLGTGTRLQSIDSTALSMDKEHAADIYATLVGGTARSAPMATRIWLDARVMAEAIDLDPATGIEQAGAAEAWDLGFDGKGTTVAVLDTGYDTDHPDLVGQVEGSKDFTGEGIEDQHGHGTHVASTISGSGAADASKTGMAPQADLLVGKVLGRSGGQSSWIIGGMEWAVAQGADVVNMSLGSDVPTDCTDPMSLASEELAAQEKTLFVVAAGNAGLRETVSAPGCAEGVLTVGALDSTGTTASFSSRGATLGQHRLKPDLAAPGVQIAGARAGGTGDELYTTMSGTSMASPHVAGAAALVRQAHPEYTAQQLKQALVSSVKDDASGTVYDEGSGELWTPAAIANPLTSEASVELADFAWPHGKKQSATKPVTYTNTSDQPIKLKLALEDLTGADGGSVPANLLKLERRTLTVPAHGQASVDLTASGNTGKLRDGAYGEIGARLIATEIGRGKAHAVTSVGFWLEPHTVNVTVKGIDRNGQPAANGYLDITDMHQPARSLEYFQGEDLTLRLRAGSYVMTSFIQSATEQGPNSYSYVGQPQMRFTEDTTVVLDARKAAKVEVAGDRPAEIRSGSLAVARSWDDTWTVASAVYAYNSGELYAAPTQRVKDGDFTFGSYVRAFEPGTSTETSPYVYNLAFTEQDRVGSGQSHQVPDSSLAQVQEHWYAQGAKGWKAQEWTRVVPSSGEDPFYTSGGTSLATPANRTAYYTADVPWQQMAQSGSFFKFPELWYDPIREYRAGTSSALDWFKLPSNTALNYDAHGNATRVAERQGDLIGFSFGQWKDSVPGRIGIGGLADGGTLEVFEDGQLLDTYAVPSGVFRLSKPEAEITAVVQQQRLRRADYWDLGYRTKTSYTFGTKQPAGNETVPLPISVPAFDLDVDGSNQAEARKDFPVSVRLEGQEGYEPGGITKLSAEVSYGRRNSNEWKPVEDYTWTETAVERTADGWRVLVDNTAASDSVVSLRLKLEDSNGTIIEQSVEHLYTVKK